MRKRIRLALLAFIVLAGIRLLVIFRERNASIPAPGATRSKSNLSADDYVVPTQVHSTDLKSAKEDLVGKTVWVKAGNQVTYLPYSGGHVDFKHPAGFLPPLKKLEITNVVQSAAPEARSETIAPGVRVRARQILVVFRPEGDTKTYAAPIGGNLGGDYTLYINDTFFFDDPHQLYRHWSQEVWSAIDRHEALKGMSELQVALALGAGLAEGNGGEFGNRRLKFDNNGHPVKVTFERNRATEIVSGS